MKHLHKLLTIISVLQTSTKFLLSVFIIAFSTFIYTALAAPPGSSYNLGETLSPTCAPGDTNCTVNTPQKGNAYLTDIAGITASQGDIIYFDGTNWVKLAPGTSGQFLKTLGTGANPAWGSAGSGSGDITKVGSMTTGAAFADSSATGDWLGLGAAAGRIEFDDQATDEVNILNAKVGIGTNSPAQLLEVSGGDVKIMVTGSLAAAVYLKENSATSTWAEWQKTDVGLRVNANDGSYTRTDIFTILDTGNVGIGNSAPSAELEVNGQIRVKGATPANGGGYSFTSPGDTDGGMFSTADGQIGFYTNNVERVKITSIGNVGIGTTASPSIDLAIGDSDTGFNWVSDGIFDIYANNAVIARIDGNGISSGGFAGRLKRVSDGAYVVPADGIAYYSPDQQGGKYGAVYRMYIPSSWVNGYNFLDIGANGGIINSAIQVLNIANSEEEVITDVSYSDIYRARVVKSTANNYLILHVGTGYTLLGGWVDYYK